MAIVKDIQKTKSLNDTNHRLRGSKKRIEKRSMIAGNIEKSGSNIKSKARKVPENIEIANIEDDFETNGGGRKKLIEFNDFMAATPIAYSLLDRAYKAAQTMGTVGVYFRRSVYYLIYHGVAQVLRTKQTKLLSELANYSGLSRSAIDNLRIAAECEIKYDLYQGKWSINSLLSLYRIKDERVKDLTAEHMKYIYSNLDEVVTDTDVTEIADRIAYELHQTNYKPPQDRDQKELYNFFLKYKNQAPIEPDNNDIEWKNEMHSPIQKELCETTFPEESKEFSTWRTEELDSILLEKGNEYLDNETILKVIRKKSSEPLATKDAYKYIESRLNNYKTDDFFRLYKAIQIKSEDEVIFDAFVINRYFDLGNYQLLIKKLNEKIGDLKEIRKESAKKNTKTRINNSKPKIREIRKSNASSKSRRAQ